jgi:hydrophobic/amphiphilic exporter-1 (mainly G- bacteria), HAE1 family
MMIAVIVVFGLNALPKIGIDLFPNIEFPVVTVVTVYPGADPTAIEEKISRKIEELVNTLPDIRTLRSISSENVSQVVIEFEMNVPIDRAVQDVRDKVSLARADMPTDIEEPLIQKFDMGAVPILTYAITGPADMSNPALTQFADKTLKQNVQKINGVGQVNLIGDRPRQVHVLVNPTALNATNLSVDDLMGALMSQNIELPGGRFNRGTRETAVRVDNQIRSSQEVGKIEVARIQGAPIFVRDLARVEDTEKEPRSYASVDGHSSINLTVVKQSGTNVVAMADKVKAYIEKMRPTYPKGIEVRLVTDTSTYIRDAIKDSGFDLIYGAFLAILIIFLFLRNRQMTMISAVAIPTSIIGTFAIIQWFGFTLNMITMLGLSLSVGIVIDDAIVVIENIFRHIEDGQRPMIAARSATNEIGLAVMATTFTIVAVFIPVAFMKGIVGRIFYQFGMTVSVAVLISLFVSFTLTPMLSSRFVRHSAKHGKFFRTVEQVLDRVEAVYRSIVSWALAHRGKVVLISVAILVISFMSTSLISKEFIPEQDEERFSVRVETPAGSSLEHTKTICSMVEKDVRALPGVDLITTTIGGGGTEKVTLGDVSVKLKPADERKYSQFELMSMLRKELKDFQGASVTVAKADDSGGGGGFRTEPIQFNIRSQDLPAMEKIGAQIADELKKVPGFVDVDTSFREGRDELKIRVDRDKAAQLGVNPASAAMAIRNLLSSAKVGEMAQGDDRYDIVLWMDSDLRAATSSLDLIKVRSMSGSLVPLTDVVTIDPGKGPTEIERQNRQRQVTIYANLENLPMEKGMNAVQEIAAKYLRSDMSTAFSGEGEYMGETFQNMFDALILAIILIYIILASQFESFIHPFTIMFSLPFSVVGAFGMLLVTRNSLSLMAMIGLIMLMGLVTKNAILLVDRANQNLRGGMPRTQALVDAGGVRLRPILMTTFAMIFGMMPVAMALSKGSEVRAPMAVTVIGGLITSTLLTLVVVPVIYTFMDDLQSKFTGKKSVKTAAVEAGGTHE